MKTQEAVAHFGGRKSLAEALGLDRSAIAHWSEFPPALRQFQIQVLTKGKLKSSAVTNRHTNPV